MLKELSLKPNKSQSKSCGILVSIDEALKMLQQSKECTKEDITEVFKACREGLERFKQTTFTKLERVHNPTKYLLERETRHKRTVFVENDMSENVSYSIYDNYKDAVDIIEKCFAVKMISPPNGYNNNDNSSNVPQKKRQKLDSDRSFYLENVLSFFETNDDKMKALLLIKKGSALLSNNIIIYLIIIVIVIF